MKQKLALSCALIHKPEILLLDEPTTGVDAVSRREFWDMLQRLRNDGLTILVSTPYMDEANRCDRVALIQSGRILRTDTPSAIASSYPWCLYSLKSADMYGLQQALATLPGMISVYRFGQYLHLSLREDSADTLRIAGFLQERGIPDAEIRPVEPGIEDCFMDMMTTSADA
jgi:ABC-type multidrug transport system ATPase subunit